MSALIANDSQKLRFEIDLYIGRSAPAASILLGGTQIPDR